MLRAGRWEATLNLLQRMRDRGEVPDEVSYGLALAACRRSRRGSRAAAMVNSMVRDSVDPSQLHLTEALLACASARAHGEANKLWEMLQSDRFSALSLRAYTARLIERARACDALGALELLQKMRCEGVAPDVVASNAALDACAGAGAWEEATCLLNRMDAEGPLPNAYSYLAAIHACRKGQQWERAIELLGRALERADDATDPTVNIKLYGATLGVCHAASQWHRCLRLLEEMQDAGTTPDHGCYGAVLDACHRAREWSLVHQLLYQMRGVGVLSPETMRPYHRSLWQQAKRELGYFKQKPTPPHKLRLRRERNAFFKKRAQSGKRTQSAARYPA